MDNNQYLKIKFSYTDEFGQENTFEQTVDVSILSDTSPLNLLVERFQSFLIAIGFPKENVDKICIEED